MMTLEAHFEVNDPALLAFGPIVARYLFNKISLRDFRTWPVLAVCSNYGQYCTCIISLRVEILLASYQYFILSVGGLLLDSISEEEKGHRKMWFSDQYFMDFRVSFSTRRSAILSQVPTDFPQNKHTLGYYTALLKKHAHIALKSGKTETENLTFSTGNVITKARMTRNRPDVTNIPTARPCRQGWQFNVTQVHYGQLGVIFSRDMTLWS